MASLHQHVSLFPLLAQSLEQALHGFILKDAFRTMEGELNLVFVHPIQEAESLSMQFNVSAKTGLFFFYEYPLERSGTVFPLFKDCIGSSLIKVQAHRNNRSFQMLFSNDQFLVFKCYGPLSNVIHFVNGAVKQLFRPEIENDFHQSPDAFDQENASAQTEKFSGKYYIEQALDADNLLHSPQAKPNLELRFQEGDGNKLFESEEIFEALHTFSKYYIQTYQFQVRQQALLSQMRQKIKREEGILIGIQKFLEADAKQIPFEEVGHILMANLHLIPKGETQISLEDFYRNQPIVINLKKDLSAQDNAAYYYSKAKNRKIEIVQKQKQLVLCAERLQTYREQYEQLENALTLKDLKPWFKSDTLQTEVPIKEKFRRFEKLGYLIYVGKNATNNDLLTLKFASKEDMWLHAKGVSGSHVIIKHKPQQSFPEPVILYAAGIAAHYSSSAGSTLVPVIYTLKKYVRKPKGAHAGQVAVEREEVVLVEPGL